MASITKNVHVKIDFDDFDVVFDSNYGVRSIRLYKDTIIKNFNTSLLTNFKSLQDFTFGWLSSPTDYYVDVRYYDTANVLQFYTDDGLTITGLKNRLIDFFGSNPEWYMKTTFSATNLDDFIDDLEYYHYILDDNFMVKYLTNSPNKKVIKDLVLIGVESIEFTRPITNQKIIIDRHTLIDEPRFNYVYISALNRYYFIDDMSMTNKMSSISLTEDVLMSFSELIYKQNAYVNRNEFTYNADIIDNRRTYENECLFTYSELSNTPFDVTKTGTTLGGVDRDLRFVITVVGKS